MDVLYVRDCAIIHFTELMHNFVNKDFSPFVKSVMQHIGLNLYSVLKVKDLSKAFFVSEATLCSRFKKETGISVIEYIHKRKISEAKLLLRAGLSPTEVAATLCYYDYAHFSHTFKKNNWYYAKILPACSPPPIYLPSISRAGQRTDIMIAAISLAGLSSA